MSTISAALDRNGALVRDNAPGALLPWWSFTKTLIATLVLRAAEAGRLDLDAPYPDHPFTWRHLLHHRAGLRDYGPMPAYQAAVQARCVPWPASELLERTQYQNLAYEIGQDWVYSNIGYLLLRQGLEQVHDMPLAELIQRDISVPLGIEAKLAQTPKDFTELHWDADGYHPGWVYHGSMVGTLPEALKVLRAILNGDLLTESSKGQMQLRDMSGPRIPGRVWSRIGYGLGLMNGEVAEVGQVLGHTGSGPFTSGLIAYFPDAPASPYVASFGPGGDETKAEFQAARIAKELR